MRNVFFVLLFSACSQRRASKEDCGRILERIVDIELKERGYRDPALTSLKQAALAQKLDAELQSCVGRKLAPRAMTCVEDATSVETLTHECLSD